MMKFPTDNCWINRFPDNLSDEKIRQRVAVAALPIPDLGVNSAEVDARRLERHLKLVYVATSNVCSLLRKFVRIGHAHASEKFPNISTYMRGLYDDFPLEVAPYPYCLTGHSGVGKSELMKALSRLLGKFDDIKIAGIEGIHNVPYWYVGINRQVTVGELFSPILQAANASSVFGPQYDVNMRRYSTSGALEKLRRQAQREGTCLVGIDELQFMTASQNATNLITRLLYQSWAIGPRLIFASNFSLIHSIKRRPDQDRQRLLSNPLLINPSELGSNDWKMTLEELLKVAPNVFDLTDDDAREKLHHFSFGINRRLVDLLVIAYRMQLENKKFVVKIEHIERAQRSAQFADHRETVNTLMTMAINRGTRKNARKDLLNPFDHLSDMDFEVVDGFNIRQAEKIIERKANRVQDDALRSSLTIEERRFVDSVEGTTKKQKNSGTVVKMPRPKTLTQKSFLEGDAAFNDQM